MGLRNLLYYHLLLLPLLFLLQALLVTLLRTLLLQIDAITGIYCNYYYY